MKTVLVGMLVLCFAVALAGCQMGPRPEIDPAPYTGPRVAIDSWALRHQITVTTPTGGWNVELDQVREGERRREVFVTAERPGRDQMVTQALVEHEVDSGVDTRVPIAVYVRLVEQGADPADFPYRLAARSGER